MAGIPEEEEDTNPKQKGHMNEDGAWCWREGCSGEARIVHGYHSNSLTECCRLSQANKGDAEDKRDSAKRCRSL